LDSFESLSLQAEIERLNKAIESVVRRFLPDIRVDLIL
jgi:hypothetical protein